MVWSRLPGFDASSICSKAYRAALAASVPDRHTEFIIERAYRDGWNSRR